MNHVNFRYFTLIVLFFTSNQCKSQLLNSYSLSLNKKQNFYITFFSSGRYDIEIMENETDDIVEAMILSYGDYLIKNNEITLIDNFHNYKMKLLKSNDSLIVKLSFKCLLNKKFVFYENTKENEPGFLKNIIDTIKIKQERIEYNNTNKIPYPLDFGLYDDGKDYFLNLEKNNTYRLAYRWCILAEGTWNRDGNIIKLYDTSLKSYFYLKIDKTGLISKYLPGDDVSVILTKRK
jgi:hypothetical protein